MPDEQNGERPESISADNIVRRRWKEFSSAGSDRHIELILAFAITFFAAAQWITSCRNNNSTSQQTGQLIDAAKVSASAATQNVQASKNFADSARSINQGIGDAVDKLNLQASATRRLVEQAVAQANATNALVETGRESAATASNQLKVVQQQFQASQRPWLSLNIEADQIVVEGSRANIRHVRFTTTNVGHSVAQTVLFVPSLIIAKNEDDKKCELDEETMRLWKSHNAGTVIFPGQTITDEAAASVYVPPSPGENPQRVHGLRLVACIFYTSPVDDAPHSTGVGYWIADKKTYGAVTADAGAVDIRLIQDGSRGTQAY